MTVLASSRVRGHGRARRCALALLLVVFGLATEAAAAITLNLLAPDARPTADSVTVSVLITSTRPIAAATASVAGRSAPVTGASLLSPWSGTVDLTGVPRGTYTLTVTVQDIDGLVAAVTRSVLVDRPPQVTITSPATDGALARPEVRVAASCTDDAPGCQIFVSAGFSQTLASATGSLDTVVSVPLSNRDLVVDVLDSAGQWGGTRIPVVVNTSPYLTHVASFPGRIVDIDATRALVLETRPPGRLLLVDRATMAVEPIFGGAAGTFRKGFLSPHGAIFAWGDEFLGTLYESRDGSTSVLGLIMPTQFVGTGRWAAWTHYHAPIGSGVGLWLRDLENGVSTLVDTSFGGFTYALSAAGDVAHARNNHVWRYSGVDGTDVPVLDDPAATYGVPVIDAPLIAAPKWIGNVSAGLVVGDGTTETTLSPLTQQYRLVNGRVAFLRPSSGAVPAVWVREADGLEQMVLDVGQGPQYNLEALGPSGDVVVSHFSFGRLLGRAGQVPFRFDTYDSGSIGSRPVWLDGEWHVIADRHLLRLSLTTTSILSEGATGSFFDTDIAILNPHPQPMPARIAFVREDGGRVVQTRTLPAMSHLTIRADTVAGVENTATSTVIDALEPRPLVATRTMSWDARGYGAHAGNAVDRPRLRWMFAEGAQGYFDTFYLLVNDGPRPVPVRARFLREAGAPVGRQFTVAPRSRLTVYAGNVAELVNQSFAATFDADEPIVAERAMYFGRTPFWSGGHESPGLPSPQERWFFAEAATGSFFDTYLLLANTLGREVNVNVVYALPDGTLVSRFHTLASDSRLTIGVEQAHALLAHASMAIYILANGPIIAERAMYWTHGGEWVEAHLSAGMPSGASRWGLAGGRTGGNGDAHTYVLVANPYFNGAAADLRIRFIDEAGGAPVEQTYTLGHGQRLTLHANDVPGLAATRFGVVVESLNGIPVYVEQSTYANADGVVWAAGTNVLGTPLQ